MSEIRNLYFIFLISYFLFLISSCTHPSLPPEKADPSAYKEPLIRANKMVAEDKSEAIDRYIERHGLDMEKTGTGLRYLILTGGRGKPLQKGEKIEILFTSKLINGTLCYQGEKGVEIGHNEMETGLDEALLLMKKGSKAIFIFPPHLAFGLTGDGNKIPPNAVLIYEIEVVDMTK